MNKVNLSGYLSRDVETRYTQGDKPMAVANFSLAVNRKGEGVDFITCKAFGKTAEFIAKYFKKGDGIELAGKIQTGSYDNADGKKIYTTDIVAEEVEFPKGKKQEKADDGFIEVNLDDERDGLPF